MIPALLFCALPTSLWAFGATAHQVVGHVAEQRVCAETLAAVMAIDGERNLADTGLWADEIRDFDFWDAAKPWHYINVPDGLAVAKARRSGRGDVLSGIDLFVETLADESVDRLNRAIAYRFLVHFIADVHQPLHVGRQDDLGGNKVPVGVDGRRTNLHAYWDSGELRRRAQDPADYAAYLATRFRGRRVPALDPVGWAQESMDYRDTVYAFEARDPFVPVELSDDYREKAQEIIDLRIYEAGVRLAYTLDSLFCEAAP